MSLLSWIEKHTFVTVIIVMFLMWGLFLLFFHSKLEILTTDPCTLCRVEHGGGPSCQQGYISIIESLDPKYANKTFDGLVG